MKPEAHGVHGGDVLPGRGDVTRETQPARSAAGSCVKCGAEMFPSGEARRLHDASELRKVRAGRAAVHGARAIISCLPVGVCASCSFKGCVACPESPATCTVWQQGHFLWVRRARSVTQLVRRERGERRARAQPRRDVHRREEVHVSSACTKCSGAASGRVMFSGKSASLFTVPSPFSCIVPPDVPMSTSSKHLLLSLIRENEVVVTPRRLLQKNLHRTRPAARQQ